ncbi:hypothetical protein HDZ31DRAFT_41873 [Schizophyllum fasciatum]
MNVFSKPNPVPPYNEFTASSHFRHPWIAKQSMKRQHSSSPSDTESSDERQVKRRRYANFERGFSRLTLADPLRNTSPSAGSSSAHSNEPDITEIELPHTEVPVYADGATPMELDTPATEVPPSMFPTPLATPTLKPASVEEPGSRTSSSSPPVQDIRMRGMHSYEPERDRVIITDLDSSSDEEEEVKTEDATGLEAAGISVSPAVLQRIRQRQLEQASFPLPSRPSQALVLFKPPPPLWAAAGEPADEDDEATTSKTASRSPIIAGSPIPLDTPASRRRTAVASAAHDFIDADDSIVLSDLVRTGEHSRLRRRGAMRLDHGLHAHAARPAAPADDIDEGTTGGPSADPMHLQRYPLRRYSSVGPADEYRYKLYCNGCQKQDSSSAQPEWLERSPSPYEPSALPLYPTTPPRSASRSPTAAPSLSCGALVHVAAAPRKRMGVWTAKSEAVDVVVPMDPEYFETSALAKVIHSPCGCVRECVGCASCGNPLGTRFKPCASAAVSLFSSSPSRHSGPKSRHAATCSYPSSPSGPDYYDAAPVAQNNAGDVYMYTFFSSSVTSYPPYAFPSRADTDRDSRRRGSSGSVDADELGEDEAPTMMFDRFVTSSPLPISDAGTADEYITPPAGLWNDTPAIVDPDGDNDMGGCY